MKSGRTHFIFVIGGSILQKARVFFHSARPCCFVFAREFCLLGASGVLSTKPERLPLRKYDKGQKRSKFCNNCRTSSFMKSGPTSEQLYFHYRREYITKATPKIR
jgi:hypothetical protein